MAANSIVTNPGASEYDRLAGYSLIELLGTLAIASLLLFIGLPNLSVMIDKSRLETRVQLLLLSIKGAKIAALKQPRRIIICRKLNAETGCADASLRGKKDWHYGWLIFDDVNRDRMYHSAEPLIEQVSFSDGDCAIVWNRGDSLSFEKFGLLRGGRAGSFSLACGAQTTQLVINWVGRVRRKN